MASDLLVGGRDPGRLARAVARLRRRAGAPGERVLAALLAVLAGAAVSLGVLHTADPAAAPVGTVRSLPRVVLTQARVERVLPQPDGVLAVGLRLEGLSGLQVLSLRVELPGSAVVLDALPDTLSRDGAAELGLSLLPRCPEGVEGLARGAVVAAVRRGEGPVREARVRLEPGPALALAVAERCGSAGAPPASVVAVPDGPAEPHLVRVRVLPAAQGGPVTVVGVAPGPGLAVRALDPLPLVLDPHGAAVPLRVELRAKGCGGAPDTPPLLLLLGKGRPVAVSVDAALRPALDALRPFRCTTP